MAFDPDRGDHQDRANGTCNHPGNFTFSGFCIGANAVQASRAIVASVSSTQRRRTLRVAEVYLLRAKGSPLYVAALLKASRWKETTATMAVCRFCETSLRERRSFDSSITLCLLAPVL